jgi:hypothetical protein
MKKKTPIIKEKVKDIFKIKITLANVVLKGEGETALIALRTIEPPVKIFTKGLIELSYEGKKMEQIWNPSKVRNLFRKITQPILAKQFTYLLR